jgi:hypothetical protein
VPSWCVGLGCLSPAQLLPSGAIVLEVGSSASIWLALYLVSHKLYVAHRILF